MDYLEEEKMKGLKYWTIAVVLLCALCVNVHAKPEDDGNTLRGNQGKANVICDVHSLQDAVDRAAEGATITVQGTCTGEVVIRKDRVRIVGESGATMQPPVDGVGFTILGDGVEISGLTFVGGAVGIDVFGGASAEIADNRFFDYTQAGIEVRANSNAVIRDNYIRSTSAPLITGVNVIASASAQLERNTIENANGNGVNIASTSSAFLACDNTISLSHPFFAGVAVTRTAQLGFGPGAECANTISNIYIGPPRNGRAVICSQTSSIFAGVKQNLTGEVDLAGNCEIVAFFPVTFP